MNFLIVLELLKRKLVHVPCTLKVTTVRAVVQSATIL